MKCDPPAELDTASLSVARGATGLAELTAPKAWTAVACLAFLFATAYAIAVVIFRLPIPGLEGPIRFRIALTLHVELAVFFWLMASLAAEWSAAAGSAGSGRGQADLALPGLAGLGTLLVAMSPLAGGTPYMADYFPWLVGNGWFATGFTLFSVAVLAAAGAAFLRALRGDEAAGWHGIGITALPVLAAAATVATSWLAGARELDQVAWAAGHTLLFAHVAAMSWEWRRMCGSNWRGMRAAVWFLALASALLPLIPFIHAPGTAAFGHAFTTTMTWLLWPPALLVGLQAIRAVYTGRGGSPRPGSAVPRHLVAVAFGFFLVGNLLGVMIDGPTTLVTAHYHAAVGAVALTRMAMTYFAAPTLAIGRPARSAVRRQLAAYAMALLLLFGGLTLGAIDAAPRKTSAGELVEKGPYFKIGMSVSGVGGLFAIVGSLWLVLNLMRAPSTGPGRPRRDGSNGAPGDGS